MIEFGEFVFTLIGLAAIVVTARAAWVFGGAVAMWIGRRTFNPDDMQWRRGTADGRPPLRYVVDGWGRVVYAELDPDTPTQKEPKP